MSVRELRDLMEAFGWQGQPRPPGPPGLMLGPNALSRTDAQSPVSLSKGDPQGQRVSRRRKERRAVKVKLEVLDQME